jgi:predicted neuraminidase
MDAFKLLHAFRAALAVGIGLSLASVVGAAEWVVTQSVYIEPAPEVPEVHASTIAQAADGTLLASWFGGSKEANDDVAIWVSRYVDGKWLPAVSVADGAQADETRVSTFNPVLHTTRDGRVLLFFKVGVDPEKWWGEVMVSRDHGKTWGERRRLPDGILGPIKNKPVLLADGTLLCPSSIEYDAKRWAVRMEITTEDLSSWETVGDLSDPENVRAIQPSVIVHPDGKLQAICRSSVRQLVDTWSMDGGRTWSPLKSMGMAVPNSGADVVTLRSGGFLLVYNPSPADASAKSWGERRPLVVAKSADGVNWETIITLETKPNRHGYAYPAVIQADDGTVHITYTWNRARIKHVVLTAQ